MTNPALAPGRVRHLATEIDAINRFIQELHRRRVFRMLAYYVVVAWLLLQAADVLFPAWDIPESGIRFVLYAAILGLPVALVFSWFYDIGPEGLRRTPPARSIAPLTLRSRDYALLGALVLVMGAIGYGAYSDLRSAGQATPGLTGDGPDGDIGDVTPVVAVLPFSTDGTDGDNTLFAEAIHEDLLAQLSRFGSLRVISRSSVQGYRNTDHSARDVGRELGAGMIVDGVVRVLGDQLRISTQLIDARTESLLWADSYDRPLDTTNLFGIQSEIAEAIAAGIGAKLTPREERQLARIPTDSMAAYRAYRTATNNFDAGMSRPEFTDNLERALELDPDFIEPMAELAGAYALISRRGMDGSEALIERAEALIDRLNELAPDSVDHLYAQSYYVYYVLNEFPRALALVDRALEMSPSNLRLWQLKSWIQRRSGDLEGRAVTLRRMMVLDPMQPSFRQSLLGTLWVQHRYDEVWAEMTPADALDPALAWPYGVLSGRHLESLEARVDTLAAVVDPHEDLDPWNRFMVPLLRRDYEAALEVARGVTDPPHWPDMPWTGSAQFQAIVAWATRDETSLRALIDEARNRAKQLSQADPYLADSYYYRRALAFTDALEGRLAETVRAVSALEQESRRDLAMRMGDLSMLCGLYAMVGHAGEATACLRMALTEPSQVEPFLEPSLPIYDPVRESPEFQALLAEF